MANSIPGVGSTSPNQVDLAETSQASKQSVQGTPQNAGDTSPTQQASDKAELSALGSLIASASKAAASRSTIRFALVASLKAQIAAGTYHPDPDEVAASVAASIKA
jgi:flagellar biosynthesis anti-sigma factor FlgM